MRKKIEISCWKFTLHDFCCVCVGHEDNAGRINPTFKKLTEHKTSNQRPESKMY